MNLRRLNHVLLPATKTGRDRYRTGLLGKLARFFCKAAGLFLKAQAFRFFQPRPRPLFGGHLRQCRIQPLAECIQLHLIVRIAGFGSVQNGLQR